jgi:sugar phosphate isomerase/epimerase
MQGDAEGAEAEILNRVPPWQLSHVRVEADPGTGKFVNIRDGSVRWPAVRAALDKIGYTGWLAIEGGELSTEEHSKRLDLIIAGK